MRTSMPRALCSSGLPCVPGTRIMSPKAAKITSGSCAMDRPSSILPIGSTHTGQPGPWTSSMFGGQQVLQAEAIDGVRVAAADFHEAVMPAGIGQAADLVGGACDQPGLAKLVDEFHEDSILPGASRSPSP